MMKISVLVVDDDPMVASINSYYVEKIPGLELICTASDVDMAKEVISEHAVDIILLDIFLGNTNGLDLLKYIRDNKIDSQVIMVSAAKDKNHIKNAMDYGVCDYLVKPFTFDRFKTAIELAKGRINKLQKDTYDQKDLDEMIFARQNEEPSKLPKGLDVRTLERITQVVKELEETFTIYDVSKKSELSRVSVKKYLDYMCATEMLEEQYVYGNIGRPTYTYRVIGKI